MQEKLDIEATSRTPAVSFDFSGNHLKISGESYPEDVTEFYGPVFGALDAYLGRLGNGSCRFDFELIYLNSSSAKAIMMLMDKLDAVIREESDGFKVLLDLQKRDRAEIVAALEAIVAQLKG
jgi:hypothetical protein